MLVGRKKTLTFFQYFFIFGCKGTNFLHKNKDFWPICFKISQNSPDTWNEKSTHGKAMI